MNTVTGGFRSRWRVQWLRIWWRIARNVRDYYNAAVDAEWEGIESSDAYRVLPEDARWHRRR